MRFRDHLREAFEDPDGGTSATRVIAIEFAQVLCVCLLVMALRDQLAGVGLPFAAIVVAVVFAVPLQAFARAVTAWLMSSEGRAVIRGVASKLASKVAGAALDSDEGADPAPGAAGAVTTTTTVNPPVAE